jgi:prepilin-type N-terminal cleavage/methylation domain-containing protein
MKAELKKRHNTEGGFSLVEVMVAIAVLLIGVVAVAQLVPMSLTFNNDNRSDSVALVLTQRELDQMLDQPLKATQFTDGLGNVCNLGNPATPNAVVGSTLVTINNRPTIDFTAGQVGGYSFNYADPEDPNGATYDVRWAVITSANGGGTVNSKRFIIGARQVRGDGYIRPLTLDTMVEK